MRDRVRCRTRLAAENENDYLPEECRAMEGDDRGHCVEDYRKVRSCWDLRGTRDRVACVRQNLGAPEDLQKEKVSCDEKLDSEKDACLNNLKAKAYGVIKFRFYNLEERAERLKEMGGGGYWKELLARIRDIRASEKVFYRQITHFRQRSEFYKKVQTEFFVLL